jgi:ABC-2 type transport system ATP-binding protein
LRTAAGVLGVAQIGNSVRVLADAGPGADGVERRLRDALAAAGVPGEVAGIEPNLEDVFVAATHRDAAGRAP